MSPLKLLGIILLTAGILGLAYRGFTYTKETHSADIGPLKLQVKEKEHVDIPIWASIAVAAAGGAMLAFGGRK